MTELSKNIVKKKNLFIILGILLMILIYFLPIPSPVIKNGEEIALNQEGKTTLAILSFAVVLWMTEAIPFPVTGLISMILLPLMTSLEFSSAVKMGFGSSIVVFFIGVMTISAALTYSGITNRFTLIILSKIGLRTDRVILAFFVTGMFLSMWVTNMAVAAMLMPIAVEILRESKVTPLKSNFGKALMITIAWGCSIGGIATPVGNGANILAMSYFKDIAGMEISFFKWMTVGLPSALLILPIAWISILKIFPPEIKELPISGNKIKQDLKELGKLKRKEKWTLIIFSIAISLWLLNPLLKKYLGISIQTEIVAIIAAALLFLPSINVLSWKEAEKVIDWGAIVLIASGLSIGMNLFETGAARWIAWVSLSNIGQLSLIPRMLTIILIVGLLKICFSSNTVTGLIVIPIVIALSLELNLDPWLVAGPAAIATSLAFILVTSSPTNVIPYSAGYFTIKEFALAGIAITIISAIIVTISFFVFSVVLF